MDRLSTKIKTLNPDQSAKFNQRKLQAIAGSSFRSAVDLDSPMKIKLKHVKLRDFKDCDRDNGELPRCER